MKATVIDEKDNVAVVLGAVKAGEEITWVKGGAPFTAPALRDVPVYHKIATAQIPKGQPVVKYGEHIGIAAEDIQVGDYVHVHNVLNNREEL
ncbi:UxaA family hydrolase [Oscillibacter sp.]|uniref:UxaA family hydrolase n=1 Tax=Oscillibacter sp. TaxID=1945593 RepID=UPI00262EB093|nr:UxaA family hydrolase [Oscillibacter sp.]MDD3347971.1 UxaA family hydrolase [Oscillibacter sp.]